MAKLTKPSDNEEYAQNPKIAAIPLVLRNCGGGSIPVTRVSDVLKGGRLYLIIIIIIYIYLIIS